MNELSIKQALNKAYLKVRPDRASITRFKTEFTRLLDTIQGNPEESEEFLKNAVAEFLKNTFYGGYGINTKGKIDLVIHRDADTASPVKVIIEAKRYANSAEMISREKPNTKALQEILLYFLRERITENNIHLKHLIITDSKKWFIFDAADFERLFSNDKQLVADFKDFESKSLLAADTGFFYKNIAAPCIDKHAGELNVTFFDIEAYEKILRDGGKENDNRLIGLYKLLSPEHLLRLPFENDSNSLNEDFYRELLYIMGLCEVKDGNKKTIIERPPEGERQEGSLLESVIFRLPSDIGDENAVFEAALELVITWVNRVLFLKLLEAQQLRYQNENKDYAFMNIATIKNFGDLNDLFFQVLAVRSADRAVQVRERYKNIPYLNSSLFEQSKSEKDYNITIAQLGAPDLDIFGSTVLKDNAGKKRRSAIGLLEYLFAFLDAYNFSSEGAEEIQETKKTLINASVLGLIFEKINGYKDGAFFTPGFITTYICRETLRPAVVQKFNEVKSWNAKTLTDVYNKIELNKEASVEANAIINCMRVCDPAVGSGHFLVSALNEVIAIKSRLRILLDTQRKRLSGYTAEVVNDELVVFDEDHELFVYNYRNAESRRVQEAVFNEKRAIIENCLFGVDINGNSVHICRLRLWIELLKNAYYTEKSEYTELETLPNIDINIKRGNSLLSMIPLSGDLSEQYRLHSYLIADYRDAVREYKNTTSRRRKTELREKISGLKDALNNIVSEKNKLTSQRDTLHHEIAAFSSVKEKSKKTEKDIQRKSEKLEKIKSELENYENAFEWRLEFPELLTDEGVFTGFDVVVGNPPYFVVGNSNHFKKTYEKQYAGLISGRTNIYQLFFGLANALLSPAGVVSFIHPKTLLADSYLSAARNYLLKHFSVFTIVNIVSRTDTFAPVLQSVIVSLWEKRGVNSLCRIFEVATQKELECADYLYLPKSEVVTSNGKLLVSGKKAVYEIAKKIGAVERLTLDFTTGSIEWNKYVKTLSGKYRPGVKRLLYGENIQRFHFAEPKKRVDTVFLDKETIVPALTGRAIVTQRTTAVEQPYRIIAALIEPENFDTPIVTENHTNVFRCDDLTLACYILGILNSRLMDFYFRLFNSNTQVSSGELNQLPVIKTDRQHTSKLSSLVAEICAWKAKDA
jgi:hypothetical protein